MRPWRRRLPAIVSIFMLWHVTAGAVAPLVMHALGSPGTSVSGPSEASTPEVCEHHAMPGAICPMHSKPEKSGNPACAIVACDSAGTELFALLACNGLLVPSVEIGAPLTMGRPVFQAIDLVSDFSPRPLFPPPRS